jgi:hypothetical protein
LKLRLTSKVGIKQCIFNLWIILELWCWSAHYVEGRLKYYSESHWNSVVRGPRIQEYAKDSKFVHAWTS